MPAPFGPSRPKTSPSSIVEVDAAHGLERAVRLAQAADRDRAHSSSSWHAAPGGNGALDAREREHDLAAVGLVADDDDGVAVPVRRLADLLGGRARREALVDLRVAEAERRRRLPRAQERAREDGVGCDARVAQPLAERARVLAAVGRQRAELVRLPGRGLGVADEEQSHRGANDSLAPMAGFRYVVADVFTDTPLTGNQLAVFTDAREHPGGAAPGRSRGR